MGFANFNWIAVIVAALIAFVFGFVYRRVLEKPWMTAAGFAGKPAFRVGPLLVVALAYLVIAGMLAGLITHIGRVGMWSSFVTAIVVWAGFVLTTIVVDHSYEARSRALTYLNAGHWFGVFLIMAIVIGLFG